MKLKSSFNFILSSFLSFLLFVLSVTCDNATIINEVFINQNIIIKAEQVVRKFEIDYERNVFLKDGVEFQYISGSFHYFRARRFNWQDILRKLKAAGLNAVSTYVEWSLHEPLPQQFQFTGDQDLEYFLELAVQEGLYVLLRPGPYICAERDFGGLPPWLLTVKPNIVLRSKDDVYQHYVKKWFEQLFPRLKRFLYGNGGPIIMVQVENEFGSYTCDKEHMVWLRDLMKEYVEDAAILYSTDGGSTEFLKCVVPGVYATVDFGTGSDRVAGHFAAMRTVTPKGPLVNSEFYPGWLTHWGEKMARVNTQNVVSTLETMLEMKASVNFYMFFGGTNFGFTAGANSGNENEYLADITSYDYDAPLTEARDPTTKYLAIRNTIAKFFPLPPIPPPKPSPKAAYTQIFVLPIATIFDKIAQVMPPVKSRSPLTFETLEQSYGFILYETIVPIVALEDPAILSVPGIRDRGYVFVDEHLVTVLYRHKNVTTTQLIIRPGQKLSIFVENMGRIGFGSFLHDPKGIISEVTLDGHVLYDWNAIKFPLHDVSWIVPALPIDDTNQPAFYTASFSLSPEHPKQPLDGYIDMSEWSKGVVFINDFNLGRYWSTVGPQLTLFLPGSCIKPYPEINNITVFEIQSAPLIRVLNFTTAPIYKKQIEKKKSV